MEDGAAAGGEERLVQGVGVGLGQVGRVWAAGIGVWRSGMQGLDRQIGSLGASERIAKKREAGGRGVHGWARIREGNGRSQGLQDGWGWERRRGK